MRRAPGFVAVAAFALVIAVQPAWAQQRQIPDPPVFGHTLFFGSGLINTPHAYVPRSSLFVTGSVALADEYRSNWSSTHARLAGGISLAKFLELGASVYTTDSYAVFGKLQVVRQSGVFPAMAVGVMNATTADIGRFGVDDPNYSKVQEATSVYGVITYTVGPGRGDIPAWVMITGGWGSGLFSEKNDAFEGDDGTGGLFGSITFDFMAADNAYVRVITEWDGFDLNLGLTAWLAGLELTIGVLSLDEGGSEDPWIPGVSLPPEDPTRSWPGHFYNQAKLFASLTVDFRALGVIPWVWTTDEEL